MFSKAKRFPEVGKDYIPGPGEYDLTTDVTGRHKRYGFLTQTSRFPEEGTESSESSEFYHIPFNQNESTASMATILSDTRISPTSSIRTASDEGHNNSTTTSPTSLKLPSIFKKSPISSSLEGTNSNNIAQCEKYKSTMQKEVEILQLKLNKMEAVIESLEADKNNTKAILLAKDLELADLRSKNATLQKTINRQENSTKAIQMQKKVEQLEEQLNSLKNHHEKELRDKKETLQELQTELNRRNFIIDNLEKSQQEKVKEIEVLAAQNTSLSAQLSEYKIRETQYETQINNLQHELKDAENSKIELMHNLETSKKEKENLEILNKGLTTRLKTHGYTISQLESRATLKDEEMDALLNTIAERDRIIQAKLALNEHLKNQFRTYRNWMDQTVIPHLISQRKETENHHSAELNQLLTELHEAKRFINRQAQYLGGLKSDVHWLTVQNQQLNYITTSMIKEHKEFHIISSGNEKRISASSIFKKPKQHRNNNLLPLDGEDNDASDTTISYSSRSCLFNGDTEHHNSNSNSSGGIISPLESNVIVLNDSGFGILVEEAK